jgi:hypothetical protein
MKIQYHKQDDILYIQFSDAPIVKDVSYGWNVNMGFTENGLGQITLLDAQADGLLPVELDEDVYGAICHLRTPEKTLA